MAEKDKQLSDTIIIMIKSCATFNGMYCQQLSLSLRSCPSDWYLLFSVALFGYDLPAYKLWNTVDGKNLHLTKLQISG